MRATTAGFQRATIATVLLAGGLAFGCAGLEASEKPVEASRVEVGQQAPDFTLSTATGVPLGLGDLRGRKSLVLVFFRGTW